MTDDPRARMSANLSTILARVNSQVQAVLPDALSELNRVLTSPEFARVIREASEQHNLTVAQGLEILATGKGDTDGIEAKTAIEWLKAQSPKAASAKGMGRMGGNAHVPEVSTAKQDPLIPRTLAPVRERPAWIQVAEEAQEFEIEDSLGKRVFVIPPGEPVLGYDPRPKIQDIEARHGIRLRTGENPLWLETILRNFGKHPESEVTFSEFCRRRYPAHFVWPETPQADETETPLIADARTESKKKRSGRPRKSASEREADKKYLKAWERHRGQNPNATIEGFWRVTYGPDRKHTLADTQKAHTQEITLPKLRLALGRARK